MYHPNDRRNCACLGRGVGLWELSVLSAWFFYKPKTAQKIKCIFKKDLGRGRGWEGCEGDKEEKVEKLWPSLKREAPAI